MTCEYLILPRWKLQRAADVLDKDGDEHGVAADIRALLARPTVQPLQVRTVADGWGALNVDGTNVGYGCSLDGWMRAVRWAERQHGVETPNV